MTIDAAGILWFLLDVSVRAVAAAAAVGFVLRALRVDAAAVRHAVWTAVLFAMLLMPVLPSVVPAIPVSIPPSATRFLDPALRPEESLPRMADDSSHGVRTITMSSSSPMNDSGRVGARPSPAANQRGSGGWLAWSLLGIYVTGAFIGLARLMYGWLLASAMIRRAKRGDLIPVEALGAIYESSEVAVPMTVGALRPIIVLPMAWKTWNADTLAAILAHESAHIRRRDASILVVARLNRAIFWFHPVAWWLERTLAVTAEHVCDDAAAHAIAAPRRYAEILVEMADVVRRNGGRIAWQAVGVDGAGLLGSRIDRLLGGDTFAHLSTRRKVVTAIACVAAIATVAACRQPVSAEPLRPDPELAKALANRVEQTKRFEAARDMTQEQADVLEQRLTVNPEDFDARQQLVTYYRTSSKVAWDKKVPGLRRHALWLIEHHPEHDVVPPPISPQFDPEGFAAAKKLWEAHLAKRGISPFLIYRAAMFFAPYDKPYTESLIRRGMALDPDSQAVAARMPHDTGGYQWPVLLSSLYAAAVRGSEGVWGTQNDLRTHVEWLDSPYAMEVRRTLETTRDAKLLMRVGRMLVSPTSSTKDAAEAKALTQVRALGVGYLERAIESDPMLEDAKAALFRIRLPDRLTEADRLANRAHERYLMAEDLTEYFRKDLARGKQQRDEAKAQAEDVLKIAVAHAQDPAYSAAVMTAHHVLALAALRDGDRERAVYHMQESVRVPTSEQMQYAPPFSWMRPVNRLLKAGERERVVEFLEAFARVTVVERARLSMDAQAIRDGRMSFAYQSMVAREGL